MIVSFLDDIYNISSVIRLVIHTVCVLISIYYLTLEHQFIHILSKDFLFLRIYNETFELIFIIFATLFWIWIINLFNFMDGMDGITATQICFFMFLGAQGHHGESKKNCVVLLSGVFDRGEASSDLFGDL